MQSSIKNGNFITIQGWMLTELQLKGNELLIYAIIYGFSQDGQSEFNGSLQYLADWTNSTKQGCLKNIKSLLEKKLIIKDERMFNGIKLCSYKINASEFNTIKQSLIPIKQSLTNNIDNNIENNINNINIINKRRIKRRKEKFNKKARKIC